MWSAVVIQIRVIVALTLRETRMAFGTSLWGYLWAVVQPLISIAFLVFIFHLIKFRTFYGDSLALFFATAVLTLEFYNKSTTSLMRAFTSNKALLTYPMVTETDTIFARMLLVASTYAIMIALFFSCLIILGMARLPAHPEQLVAAFLATLLLGLGVGTIFAVLYANNSNWQYVDRALGRPLFFLSGVFYVPSRMPPEAVEILKWNPVLHLVEWMRLGYYQDYPSDVFNPYYPLGISVTLIAIGFTAQRITRKKRSGA